MFTSIVGQFNYEDNPYLVMTRVRKPGNLNPGRPVKYDFLKPVVCHHCGRTFDTKNGWIAHIGNCHAYTTYQKERESGFCLIIYNNYFRVIPKLSYCKRYLKRTLRTIGQMGADIPTKTNMFMSALVTFSCIEQLAFESIGKEEAASIKWETPVINAETV